MWGIHFVKKVGFLGMACLALAACDTGQGTAPSTEKVDTVITGGLLYDGTGGKPYTANIAIKDGTIVYIGTASDKSFDATTTIDATGLMVTPGFIDMHSHNTPEEDYAREGLPYIYQGITTTSLGLDGFGTPHIKKRYDSLKKTGFGPNLFSYVGHNTIRRTVMGDADRAPTDTELKQMKSLVKTGMDEGAFGLSSGLFYVPGSYSSTDEVVALASVAAPYGGIYDTHDRDLGAAYKGIGYLASIKEGIEIGERSGTRVIFSHFNAQGIQNYGRANEGAALINEARARGVDVAGAQHVYNATRSSLSAYALPRWAAAGGYDAIMKRFEDPEIIKQLDVQTMEMLAIRGGASKIKLVDPSPDINGLTLDIAAQNMGLSVQEAVRQLIREKKTAVMNLELYDDNNTRYLAKQSWMMTCTDGRPPHPDQASAHPRTYGAFTKKLYEYVIEDNMISMAFAVRSMSGLAADFLGLENRGYLKVGQAADIAVFDRDKIKVKATYEAPKELSEGTVHVLVNGDFLLKDGAPTGALSGVAILRGGETY
ncbi:N-acyl-D-amino-acid deacylase [Kordiimonas sediminis]|uniref:N-acyl-D-amino-acid deacylase n=1 Tax=Kordiimonas sediminis TaxID=1735581 RepID=A0A919E452_9PROT|nr:amidohydrolase family protein [Kordiimonas sediminis]GHF17838.1 N-acyl-D-amino-acid deacylase [Kordiimonas sediminis]